MSDIKIDSDGDIILDNFDLVITDDGSESLAQRLSIKLRFFKGEWFLNLGFGIPWFQDILKKGVSSDLVDTILRDQIINTEGVVQLTAYSSSYDNSLRAYAVDFTVTSTNGDTVTISESI